MAQKLLSGSMINNYEVLDRIGQGGMGEVYVAKHPQIGKMVAIKVLRASCSKNPQTMQRFFQEARIVNEINHQHVVDILDFGQTPQGDCYIIMEYLEGETLTSLVKGEGPLPRDLIGHIGLQICSVLSIAHEKGIVHRDLKSDNVFLIERDSMESFVKILDFGIAKRLDGALPLLTAEGTTMGTPVYMSPEQALGHPVNGQTDIYAFGVLLYYMATRTYPFFDRNPIVVANMQVSNPLPLPHERFAGIDARLESVIIRCLEKDRALRYSCMLDVASDLGRACGLGMGAYFGKKRSLVTQELTPLDPLSSSAGTASLVLLSSEVVPKKTHTARHFPMLITSVLMGGVGLSLLIASAVHSGLWGSFGLAEPSLAPIVANEEASPSSLMSTTQRGASTMPTEAAKNASPVSKNAPQSQKAPKKNQRAVLFKNLRWFAPMKAPPPKPKPSER